MTADVPAPAPEAAFCPSRRRHPTATIDTVTSHAFDHVEEGRHGFVLVCACGWRTGERTTAAEVGHEWDRHLAEHA